MGSFGIRLKRPFLSCDTTHFKAVSLRFFWFSGVIGGGRGLYAPNHRQPYLKIFFSNFSPNFFPIFLFFSIHFHQFFLLFFFIFLILFFFLYMFIIIYYSIIYMIINIYYIINIIRIS